MFATGVPAKLPSAIPRPVRTLPVPTLDAATFGFHAAISPALTSSFPSQ